MAGLSTRGSSFATRPIQYLPNDVISQKKELIKNTGINWYKEPSVRCSHCSRGTYTRMCIGEGTTFLFPDGQSEAQHRYILCEDSRDGRPCSRVDFVNAGTRYVPGAQPSFWPSLSHVRRSNMNYEEGSFEVPLPSLTDGATASSISTRKTTRPRSGEKKYFVDGAKFHFELPFGRSRSKRKKEKEKEKHNRKSKSKEEAAKSAASNHHRHSSWLRAVYPEAPDPPAAAHPFGQQMPAEYSTFPAMTSPNLPPFSSSEPYRIAPVHYTQGLDSRVRQPTVYEERVPPNVRYSSFEQRNDSRNHETVPSQAATTSSNRRNSTHAPRTSRHSVNFDLPPLSRGMPQPTSTQTASVDNFEYNGELRRYELREAERERNRQERIISDLNLKLAEAKANEEQLYAQLREAEVELQRQQGREGQPQSDSFDKPSSSTGATAGSAEPRRRPPPTIPTLRPDYPHRSYSERFEDRHHRAEARHAERGQERTYEQQYMHERQPPQPSPPLRRHDSHRSRPSPAQTKWHTSYEPGRSSEGTKTETQKRISDIRASIAASVDLRHKIEEDLDRQIEFDARQDTLDSRRDLPRLNAYNRLVGADRGRNDMPWDPGRAYQPPMERDRARGRGSWGQRLRHAQHASDDLRGSFERVSISRGDQDSFERRYAERPWSWERERRQY